MTLVAICDFCDKQMKITDRYSVTVTLFDNKEGGERQLHELDLCATCFDGLNKHIKHRRENRSAR